MTEKIINQTTIKLPTSYWIWLVGVLITMLGTQALSFGMVWEALSYGPIFASIVLLAVVAPRVALTFFGGVVSDRVGPARVMIISDACMLVIVSLAFAGIFIWGASMPLILGLALFMGIADAFYLPASGAIPKYLVGNAGIPRAMAARQLTAQGSALFGPALGGIAIGAIGLKASLALGAVGFGVMLLILVLLRASLPMRSVNENSQLTVKNDLAEAFGILKTNTPIRQSLVLMLIFSMLVMPFTPFLVPLVATESAWGSELAGLAMGIYGLGMAVVTLLVLWKGTLPRERLVALGGIGLSGVGFIAIGLVDGQVFQIISVAAVGIGAGLFATHIGPMFIKSAPMEHISKLQAAMVLAQSVPLLVINPVLGGLSEVLEASTILLVLGILTLGICAFMFQKRGAKIAS